MVAARSEGEGRAPVRRVTDWSFRLPVPGQIIAATYEELAEELGRGFTAHDVHVALTDLRWEHYFHGRPHLSAREFRVRPAR